jgi:exosome complex exonuclease RRP6
MRQGGASKRIPSSSTTSNPKTQPPSSYDHDNLIMDQTQDFKSLQDEIQAALLSTTRISAQISSEDLGFQRSLNSQVGTSLDEQSERLLELAGSLLKSAASISELQVPTLDDADDVDSNWRAIVDVVDSLLEKTDIGLDEYTGVIKRKETPITEQASR